MINRETFRIEIEGKKIWYADRRWDRAIKLIPRDKDFLKRILFSRGKIPPIIKNLFSLTKTEQEEYDNAKDSRELADICIRDCRRHGAILIKEETTEEDIKDDIETEGVAQTTEEEIDTEEEIKEEAQEKEVTPEEKEIQDD